VRHTARVRRQIIDGVILRCAEAFHYCHRNQDAKLGRDYDLDIDWVCEKITLPCSYCGLSDMRRTLDRIDNSVGHTKQNCVAACIRCNLIRGNMPHEAWMALVPSIKAVAKSGLFGDWCPRRLMTHKEQCGSSSVVERLLAKQEVASPILVSRSNSGV
jgi:hypothetical protein